MDRVSYYCKECKSIFKKMIRAIKIECPICGSCNVERKNND